MASPHAGLIQATDGNFYGTLYVGGTYSDGSIFSVTPSGILKTLHSFNGMQGSSRPTRGWSRIRMGMSTEQQPRTVVGLAMMARSSCYLWVSAHS